MKQNLSLSIALLERGPATLDALLRGLPAAWAESTEGDNTWSPRFVVAHLVHCERVDWMRRVRVILEHGELKPFEPVDREAAKAQLQSMSMEQLLDEFRELRRSNLEALAALNLGPQDYDRTGIHPVFGSVTLSQLLATWATHDMTHLHQLSRILASQYGEAVGPWKRFLGVLHCQGHSE